MLGYEIQPLDSWILYELCGESLGSALYDLKSCKNSGPEKIYKVIIYYLILNYLK